MKYTKANPLSESLGKEQFIEIYHEQGMLIKEIAEKYVTSVDAVTRLRRKYAIKPVNNGKRTLTEYKPSKSLLRYAHPDEVQELYWEDNLSMEDLAEYYQCTRAAVSAFFKRKNISSRDKSAARRVAKDKGKLSQQLHSVRETLFDTWSEESSWMLGYLFVKGLISGEVEGSRKILTIVNADTDVLENIRNKLGSSHPLVPHQIGESISHRLEIANVRLVERLLALGVKQEREERTINERIPHEYDLHFLCGFFAAGGEFGFETFWDHKIQGYGETRIAAFRHKSRKLLIDLLPMLERLGIREAGTEYQERNKSLFQLEYYDVGYDQLYRLLHSVDYGRELLLNRRKVS